MSHSCRPIFSNSIWLVHLLQPRSLDLVLTLYVYFILSSAVASLLNLNLKQHCTKIHNYRLYNRTLHIMPKRKLGGMIQPPEITQTKVKDFFTRKRPCKR